MDLRSLGILPGIPPELSLVGKFPLEFLPDYVYRNWMMKSTLLK